jgi:histidinol-phosphatase (PHP family)
LHYSCLHTHTNYCDGKGSIEDFCKAAFEKGFVSLGFSPHAPLLNIENPDTSWHMKLEDFAAYSNDILQAKQRWKNKLPVFAGLEIDYIEDRCGPADWEDNCQIEKNNLDYRIGSVHYITETRCVDSSGLEFEELIAEDFCGDVMAMVDAYWNKVEKMIAAGGFDILGHADVIKKNNKNNKWFLENDDRYVKNIRRIADAIADAKIVVEANSGGMIRGHTDSPYPSQYFLKLLCKNKVSIVISADAHAPEHLGGHYEDVKQILLEAGYDNIVFFEGRLDGKSLWRKEAL